mgnify:CR=1 FL=1
MSKKLNKSKKRKKNRSTFKHYKKNTVGLPTKSENKRAERTKRLSEVHIPKQKAHMFHTTEESTPVYFDGHIVGFEFGVMKFFMDDKELIEEEFDKLAEQFGEGGFEYNNFYMEKYNEKNLYPLHICCTNF